MKTSSALPIQNCGVTSRSGVITLTFPISGFQITAQINKIDEVNLLHINTTMDPQTPVTVQVAENGEYLVTVFPIQDGVGILSRVKFSQIHVVDDIAHHTR